MGVESSPDTLISNGNLIKKVYFPREILVVASTASILVNFGIELGVLGVLLLIVGNMVLPWIPLLLVLVAIQFVLVLGLALLLSVLNVYFRDVKHFVSLSMKILFYTVPVVYPLCLVPKHKEVAGMSIPVRQLYEFNPLVAMVECYRAVLYDLRFPSLGDFAYFLGVGGRAVRVRLVGFLEARAAPGGGSVTTPAVDVVDVSKRYRLYHERNQSLKASVMRGRRVRYEEFVGAAGRVAAGPRRHRVRAHR